MGQPSPFAGHILSLGVSVVSGRGIEANARASRAGSGLSASCKPKPAPAGSLWKRCWLGSVRRRN